MLDIFMDMNGLNYNQIMPLPDMENPDPKQIFDNLVNSDAVQIFKKRHRNFQIGVWELAGVQYVVQSVKGDNTPDGFIYRNTIYMLLEDGLAIAKFLDKVQRPMAQTIKSQTKEFLNDYAKGSN